jgi:hypothetical protein
MSITARTALEEDRLYAILYADDTLLVGVQPELVEEFAAAVEAEGAKYGMTLHWGKTQVLSVATGRRLKKPDGSVIEETGVLEYLGSLLAANGRVDSELSRKIGCATHDFRNLQALWNHASVSTRDKLQFFHALIVSRLIGEIATTWLLTSQRRRLDGFYVRCIRKILRIPPAYVSRISNTIVLARAQAAPLSERILQKQLQLLGRAAMSQTKSPLRRDVFVGDGLQPQIGRYVRRIGRPRQDWTSQLILEADKRLGRQRREDLLSDRSDNALNSWYTAVARAFK